MSVGELKNVVSIIEVSRHGGVESVRSYDGNFYNSAEDDFCAMVEKEFPEWHEDMIADAVEAGHYDKKSGNTVVLVRKR